MSNQFDSKCHILYIQSLCKEQWTMIMDWGPIRNCCLVCIQCTCRILFIIVVLWMLLIPLSTLDLAMYHMSTLSSQHSSIIILDHNHSSLLTLFYLSITSSQTCLIVLDYKPAGKLFAGKHVLPDVNCNKCCSYLYSTTCCIWHG